MLIRIYSCCLSFDNKKLHCHSTEANECNFVPENLGKFYLKIAFS